MIQKIKIKLLSYLILVGLTAVILPAAAWALPVNTLGQFADDGCSSGISIFPHWYDNGICQGGQIVSPNTMPGADTGHKLGVYVSKIAMNIVDMILYVVGYVSLIFIIWGGFKYMLNGDNSGGTVAARKTIQNAIIGLVLSIMSVSIVMFIANRIQ